MADYSKMTFEELEGKRTDFVQELAEFTTEKSGLHRSEIEDEIKKIDEHLSKYE